MSRIKTEKLQDFLVEKEMDYAVRLTGHVHGENKKTFLCDCIQKDWNESKLINHILSQWYAKPENRPTINEATLEHFRKDIAERKAQDELRNSAQMLIQFLNVEGRIEKK